MAGPVILRAANCSLTPLNSPDSASKAQMMTFSIGHINCLLSARYLCKMKYRASIYSLPEVKFKCGNFTLISGDINTIATKIKDRHQYQPCVEWQNALPVWQWFFAKANRLCLKIKFGKITVGKTHKMPNH